MSSQPASDQKPLFDTAVYPHCLNEVGFWLPAQPLYLLGQARGVLLIPTRAAMHTLLWRHKAILDPPRYAHGPHGRRYRLLTRREIRLLRDRIRLTLGRVMRCVLGPAE